MKSETAQRVYVDVKAAFNAAGNLMPLEIRWIDGNVYEIDKVTDIRQAAAMKSGGNGDRYTIRVQGKQTYLFFERSGALSGNNLGRWFVEGKAV